MREQTIKVNGKETHWMDFDSIYDLTEQSRKVEDHKDGLRQLNHSLYDPEFVGETFADIGEACGKLEGRWEEGDKAVEKLIASITDQNVEGPKSKRRKRRYSETDGDFDFDRFLDGESCFVESYRDFATGTNYIPIVANMATSADLDPSVILWRAAVAIVLADRLEDAGYRCEIWAASLTGTCGSSVYWNDKLATGAGQLTTLKLKGYDEPVAPSALISAVAGWCYRTVWFGARFAKWCDKWAEINNAGSVDQSSDAAQIFLGDDSEHMVYINNCWNEREAIRTLRDTFKTFDQGN